MTGSQLISTSMDALQLRRGSHCLACGLSTSWQPKGSQPRHFASGKMTDRRLQPMKAAQTAEAAEKAEQYNKSMSSQMGWEDSNPYEYHPERGLYYHEVTRNLICGSQPQTREDIEHLHFKERVTNVINLQEDKDFGYWGVDFHSYASRAKELGMFLDRRPIVDFDGESLRRTLPAIVKTLEGALSAGGRVYIHCTAGLGRAPAACIAWMYWFGNRQLDEAYSELTEIRPCGPRRDAIRAATYDLLDSRGWHEFHSLPPDAWAFLSEADMQRLQKRLWEQS